MPDDTRDLILKAAFEEFSKNGRAGARMQAIADRAQINKAMLNYYFKSKDELYAEVIREGLNAIKVEVIKSSLDPKYTEEELITHLVEQYTRFWSKNTELLHLIFHDLLSGGKSMKMAFERSIVFQELPRIVNRFKDKKNFRTQDPRQIMLHIMGLSMIIFLQMPIVKELFSEYTYEQIIEVRIQAINDFIKNGLFRESPSPIQSA